MCTKVFEFDASSSARDTSMEERKNDTRLPEIEGSSMGLQSPFLDPLTTFLKNKLEKMESKRTSHILAW